MITCRNGPALPSTHEHRTAHLFTPNRGHSLSSSIIAQAAFVLSGAVLRQPSRRGKQNRSVYRSPNLTPAQAQRLVGYLPLSA